MSLNNFLAIGIHPWSAGITAKHRDSLKTYKPALQKALGELKQKRDDHPELFDADDSNNSGQKTLLDALYEEGIIPTYSFPKNVVSTYISGTNGKIKYQVERGLDVAIGEYAPGRSIVVDKTTYQIGGFFYPGTERSERTATSPARAFIQDANYRKSIGIAAPQSQHTIKPLPPIPLLSIMILWLGRTAIRILAHPSTLDTSSASGNVE